MEKKILFLFVTLSLIIKTNAQIEVSYLSGTGYTNITTVNKPGIINNTYSEGIGFSMGGLIEYPVIKEQLFVKTGLFYSEKGAFYPLYNTSDGSIISKRRENVYYLESPLQLQFRFFPLFKLQAGIYNAIRLNMAKNEEGFYDNSYVYYNNRYDFGYIVGINVEYKRLVLEVNYLKSIKHLGNIARWDVGQGKIVLSDDTKFFNQNLFFTIGYKILTPPDTEN